MPFWQQGYTNLVRFTIEPHRLEERPWFTLQDVYRLAIAGDRFLARIEEAGQRLPPAWPDGADTEAAPVERAWIPSGDFVELDNAPAIVAPYDGFGPPFGRPEPGTSLKLLEVEGVGGILPC